ncbi:MAG: hypothetical protein ACXW4B_05340 [Micavibrio sp.]
MIHEQVGTAHSGEKILQYGFQFSLNLFATVLLILFGFSRADALAQNKSEPEKIKVGDEYYTRGQIVADFLNVAFSEKLWNEDLEQRKEGSFGLVLDWYSGRNWDLRDKGVQERYQTQKEWVPWLADYMYRPDGWPRHNVINKWVGEVSIGAGYPDYTFAPNRLNNPTKWGNPHNPVKTRELAPYIEEQVEALMPDLEKATGLSIRFLSLGDPIDKTENHARIRIVPMTPLRSRSWVDQESRSWTINNLESWFWGGVLFESSDILQMDAFMLPNADNTTGLVVCKIKDDLPIVLFKALVTECVTRALGLPGMLKTKNKSVLWRWRESFSDYGGGGLAGSKTKLPLVLEAYDKFMVGLLYCPDVKPGMDKNQILKTLLNRNSCL